MVDNPLLTDKTFAELRSDNNKTSSKICKLIICHTHSSAAPVQCYMLTTTSGNTDQLDYSYKIANHFKQIKQSSKKGEKRKENQAGIDVSKLNQQNAACFRLMKLCKQN